MRGPLSLAQASLLLALAEAGCTAPREQAAVRSPTAERPAPAGSAADPQRASCAPGQKPDAAGCEESFSACPEHAAPCAATAGGDAGLPVDSLPAQPSPPVTFKGEVSGSHVMVKGPVVFVEGKAELRPSSGAALREVKQFLDDNPHVTRLRVEVHTDGEEGDDADLKLSGLRAIAVVRSLAAEGVANERLIAVGFGGSRPKRTNSTPANRAINRRTEFHVATVGSAKFLGRDASGGGRVFPLRGGAAPGAAGRRAKFQLDAGAARSR